MITRTLTAAVVLAAFTGSASAQRSKAQDAADAKEIQNYTLTMPVLQKMAAAAKAAAIAIKNDPRYRDDESREKAIDDASGAADADNATLSDMERSIGKIPHMSEALKSVGLTAREYATFSMCAFQAAMVAAAQKSGVAMKLPEGLKPANVQFMKDHEKDFAALQSAMVGQ